MGKQKKRKTREKKERKPKRKRPARKAHKMYDISGGSIKRTRTTCPKCGPSHFLAKHKDRVSCGRCGYTEFGSRGKREQPKIEDNKGLYMRGFSKTSGGK